jgi:simple sugar transport system permease protein
MTGSVYVSLVATVMTAATPLAWASLGELVAERAGVLNLGVEGMMLAGAVAGFAATLATGNHALGIAAGAGAGMALALLFGLLTIWLASNQVATGLALTIFGTGVSTLVGQHLTGHTVTPLGKLHIPLLDRLPVVGVLADQDVLVLGSLATAGLLAWAINRTRAGMVLRAVGENAEAAHRIGLPVRAVRLAAVLFGGALAGVGGAYLSIAYTPLWAEGMTAGRGWIALSLVVFGSWRPMRVLGGAYLFGGIAVLQLYLQGSGLHLPTQLFATVPYLATIVVLAALSSGKLRRLAAPAGLGKPFRAMG